MQLRAQFVRSFSTFLFCAPAAHFPSSNAIAHSPYFRQSQSSQGLWSKPVKCCIWTLMVCSFSDNPTVDTDLPCMRSSFWNLPPAVSGVGGLRPDVGEAGRSRSTL